MNKKESMHLPPSEEKALHYIIEHGSTYAYHLGHTLKILETEKTANIALNNLARKGFLQKQSKKEARERKMYSLTLKGLCKALAFSELTDPVWLHLEKVIEKYSALFPLLTKYETFKKHGLEEYFKQSLRRAVKSTPEIFWDEYSFLNEKAVLKFGDTPVEGKFIENLLIDVSYRNEKYRELFGITDDLLPRLVQVLRVDADLKSIAEFIVRDRIQELEEELKEEKVKLSFLDSLKE
jgi:DNA-binding PadR family transcriptional regulator